MTSRSRSLIQTPNCKSTLSALILLGLGPGPTSASVETMGVTERPPNLVFVLADDLGYGDLGCYGQPRIATPRLDRMAAEGMRFTHFYAGSTVCAPSRCALMTGLHTGHCRIRGNSLQPLVDADVTIAEDLRDRGYATALIGKWGLGLDGSSGAPTRQGFDQFFGYLSQTRAHNYYPEFLWRNEQRVALRNVVTPVGERGGGVASEKHEYSHDLFIDEALAWIDQQSPDRPFFLYLALTIPHANNEARQEGMEVPELGPYAEETWPAPQRAHAAMISRLDRDVGRLLDRLRERGQAESTLVIFSSDNGPHSEGGAKSEFFDSNGPLRGMKRDLTDGGIRVPTIAWWPGVVPARQECDVPLAFWDVLPTFCELAGDPCDREVDGLSFVPALRGQQEQQPRHDALYWCFFERGGAQAVRFDRYKAIAKPAFGPVQIYDVIADPEERENLAEQHPELVARAKELFQREWTKSEQWSFPDSGQ